MGQRSSYEPGTFSWVDLGTSDPDGAKEFYEALFGWEHEDMPAGENATYTMFRIDGQRVAALYEMPQQQASQGVPPNWLSYVTVEDIDASARQVEGLGGTLVDAPFDVLDAGRMAVVADPTGAVFALWQPGRSIGAELVNVPGALSLNQLNTTDPDAARSFYEGLFGWTFESVGTQETPYWGIFNDGKLNGGMMPMPAQGGGGAPPHWLAYFNPEDLDAAAERIGELGGKVVVPPMPVPGGRILVAQDPQGAHFALVEGRMDP